MSLMPQTSISGDRRGSAPATAVCLFVCALGLLAGVRPAAACSICRCGDPTFNSLGSDIYDAGRFRLALDWERFDKDQGAADARESVLENRVTTAMSYTFSDRFTAVARVPYSSRSLHSTGGGDAATGAASLRVADVGASSLDTSGIGRLAKRRRRTTPTSRSRSRTRSGRRRKRTRTSQRTRSPTSCTRSGRSTSS